VTRVGFRLLDRLQKSPGLQASQARTARTQSLGHMTSAHPFARAVIVVEMVHALGIVLLATMESVLVRQELQDITRGFALAAKVLLVGFPGAIPLSVRHG